MAGPAPSGRPRWLLPLVALAALFLLAAVVGGVFLGRMLLSGSEPTPGTTPDPVAAGGPKADGDAPKAAAVGSAASSAAGASATAAVPPGGSRFVSAAPDTDRITVSCGGVETRGATEVAVAPGGSTSCSVQVKLKDLTRLHATVSPVEPGTYRCFEGESRECVR